MLCDNINTRVWKAEEYLEKLMKAVTKRKKIKTLIQMTHDCCGVLAKKVVLNVSMVKAIYRCKQLERL